MTEEILKVSSDEVQVKNTTEVVTTINVEELETQKTNLLAQKEYVISNCEVQVINVKKELESQRDALVAQVDVKLTDIEAQLNTAAQAGVTPDGVVGETIVETAPVEPVIETPTEETETPVVEETPTEEAETPVDTVVKPEII